MSHPDRLTARQNLEHAKRALGIPTIVVICGSTRFWEEMSAAAWQETLDHNIVVRPDVDMKRPGDGWADAEAVKVDLDEVHRGKIRLASEALVVGDYAGDSTRAEIAYARGLGMKIRFTSPALAAEFADPAPAGEAPELPWSDLLGAAPEILDGRTVEEFLGREPAPAADTPAATGAAE